MAFLYGSQYPGMAQAEGGRQSSKSQEIFNVKSLREQSQNVTKGVIILEQENKTLKEELQRLTQTQREQYRDEKSLKSLNEIEESYQREVESLQELLREKENEVDHLKRRLGAMSEKKINQDQRITENTLSVNRQSDLEEEFKNNFKDGERVVAIELIENKSQSCHFSKSTKDDHLKASRLACLIFEVAYECALELRENYAALSSSILNTLIAKAPTIAFLDEKQPVCKELIPPKRSSKDKSGPVEDTMIELMTHVKEKAASKKLDISKFLEDVKAKTKVKWRSQIRSVPDYNEKLLKALETYIDYCCRFSWRLVTQLPPLKIGYHDKFFDRTCHTENRYSTKTGVRIKCFLWPILLDCDKRVIAKGEVLLAP
ncbi:PREDICTED: uncharacterized protein LOC107327922 [Acropora digitifera]|uniref:uncharacterized protein LOC107327922 n=1 Tax=Acropora digitifera TaxID=70779 RepID=UPI00077AC48B|nr:PREDICTED: uncharacterized protein LOC107327922 [Acropora digitifera]XP_015748128.1 PREDICTED: uncharacterized protein LOC107327922 [Acropora digitifera]